jgi:hypothetical protein
MQFSVAVRSTYCTYPPLNPLQGGELSDSNLVLEINVRLSARLNGTSRHAKLVLETGFDELVLLTGSLLASYLTLALVFLQGVF